MAEPGAALGGHQVVAAVLPVQVRALQATPVAAAPVDAAGRTDIVPRVGVELLEHDGPGMLIAVPRIPFQGDHPVPAVVVVEEGWVESDAAQVGRSRSTAR